MPVTASNPIATPLITLDIDQKEKNVNTPGKVDRV